MEGIRTPMKPDVIPSKPEPQTLNPIPGTPNPKPPNPKPERESLNPKPCEPIEGWSTRLSGLALPESSVCKELLKPHQFGKRVYARSRKEVEVAE